MFRQLSNGGWGNTPVHENIVNIQISSQGEIICLIVEVVFLEFEETLVAYSNVRILMPECLGVRQKTFSQSDG